EPSEPEVEVNEELAPMDPSEPAPETEEELPGPAYAQTPLTEALGVDSWGDAFDGAPADPLPLREETGVLISEPSKPILLTTPASSEEAAEVELGTFDDPEPVPLSHPVPPSPAPVEFPEFDRRLRAGTPLLRTQRFNMHTPTEPAEILVSAWLESADTLEGLQRLARGQLSEDRISKVVFQFYSRRLIDLPP
ncbi:MAG TPA: hypothetical protein VEY30_01555, partial [Myxococcaceae bacterium]|nr:hypothetical protein [Myxococcaceae bacterium]